MSELEITLRSRKYWICGPDVFTTYAGSGTVWHDVATGRRPGTHTEAQLAEIAWKRDHEKKSAKK